MNFPNPSLNELSCKFSKFSLRVHFTSGIQTPYSRDIDVSASGCYDIEI